MTSELRYDPLRRHRVILSASRAARPNDFRTLAFQPIPRSECPFCEGNERETPPEVAAERPGGSAADGPGWSIRVVPNRFPAVAMRQDLAAGVGADPCREPALGVHEVVIETPRHDAHPAEYDRQERLRVLRAYRDRFAAIAGEPGIRYLVLFRNSGPRSGASLRHPHTQLMGMVRPPAAMEGELQACAEHRAATGRCLACDLLAEEAARGERVLRDGGRLLVYLPFAGRFPAETFVTPRHHPAPFAAADDDLLDELGDALTFVVERLRRRFPDASFNWVLHTLTGDAAGATHHWRFEVFPRLGQVGGFELGTGMFINSLPPEQAARMLRGEA